MQGVPSEREYQGGFGTALMIKDLNLAMQSAHEITNSSASSISDDASESMNLPMAEKVLELYQRMANAGPDTASKDFGGIYQYVYKGQAAGGDQ